ncbi:MAG: glycine oxidase ThiO [Parvularculaceae bacterium]|nr:glycine oxidase ThiO [Parvularculaceae bacterium]
MTSPDIVIAGGGVIGLMTAYALAREGARVTVIDAGAPSATAAAAGMLAPSFESALHAGAALERFARSSLARWRAIAPEITETAEVAIDFRTNGILSVAFDDDDAARFPEDMTGGVRLSVREARALEPALSPAIAGAWFADGDGQVDPRALLRALPAAIARHGGRLVRGKRVAAIDTAHGAVAGVRLSSGERMGAGVVILATGAAIAAFSALPAGAIFPVKGEAVALATGEGAPAHVIRTRSAYLCPKADGRVIVGATQRPHDRSLTTDAERIDALKSGAARAAPALTAAAEIERWAGLRPATADGSPVIGPAPEGPAGLFHALGHYRNGVLLAPATAAALMNLILKGEGAKDLAAFSAGRFRAT